MKEILLRVPIFLGSVFLMVLATAAPLLALALILGAAAFYLLSVSRPRDALDARPVPVRAQDPRRR